jgi:hypothetical protein
MNTQHRRWLNHHFREFILARAEKRLIKGFKALFGGGNNSKFLRFQLRKDHFEAM